MTYKYDLFLSYRNYGRWRDWIESHFLPNLKQYLGEDLGHSMVDPQTSQPKIFYDKNNLSGGQRWPKELKRAVLSSRVLVPLFSRQYFGSPSCRKELAYMLAKETAVWLCQ
ncbi:MAG: toll/interleukin-1 receptor domain-containing protein [Prochloron sp. SP5CPC1]|nr:toll/interleukin-1 receptor domain-containing protein [Candidatus Paraprochloron terpiosi SP5CPC1]